MLAHALVSIVKALRSSNLPFTFDIDRRAIIVDRRIKSNAGTLHCQSHRRNNRIVTLSIAPLHRHTNRIVTPSRYQTHHITNRTIDRAIIVRSYRHRTIVRSYRHRTIVRSYRHRTIIVRSRHHLSCRIASSSHHRRSIVSSIESYHTIIVRSYRYHQSYRQ